MKQLPIYIRFCDVSLRFRLYTDKGISIKEAIINKLKKRQYGSGTKEFWVLQHINLEVRCGDRLGVIGNNGTGKSTMLKLISNIYTPTSGTIHVSGTVAPLIELGAGFNPELTGRENIYLNGAVLGYTKDEMSALEQSIIEFSELDEFIDVPVKYYSSGMYMRLAFTVATQIDPDILIVDEIFAAGDMNFVQKAKSRINKLLDSAKIVIMVSHSLELIEQMCNRCIVLAEHGIAFDGTPREAILFYEKLNKR